MYILEKIKQDIVEQINQIIGSPAITLADLIYPPQAYLGDISLPCFNKSKLGLTGVEILSAIAALKPSDYSVTLAGAYLNFKINKALLAEKTLTEIDKTQNQYGLNENGEGEKVMIEYSNANTHKEYHVGHLRNICYGDAINRILSANGYKAIPVSYINDFGIHVAKTLWAYKKFYEGQPLPENKGKLLGEIYTRSVQEMANDKLAAPLVALVMKKIESQQGEEYMLWQETRQWSIDGFAKIYQELGIKFEHIFYESEYVDQGKELVDKMCQDGILKTSDGAVIADFTADKLGVLVVIRADGTALYPVADLALAAAKFKKYKINKSIYIVDIRQSLYFKQVFRILSQLGFKQEMVHLDYDFVKLPNGMMSSRSGNVITYYDLHEQLLAKATEETKQRHTDWPEDKVAAVAEALMLGAIKFEMLKVNAHQIINFDIDQAMRFDGFTAGYLQYTCARINSIIRKSEVRSNKLKVEYEKLNEEKEVTLIMEMAKYPEVVSAAGVNYDPSEIAKYLFALAQNFNDYYHAVPILKVEPEIMAVRLALIAAVRQVIANGLNLLGIEVIEEM